MPNIARKFAARIRTDALNRATSQELAGRSAVLLLGLAALGLIGAGWIYWFYVPRESGVLAQEAYVWQRAWTEPVRAAVRQHGAAFASLVVLHAEIAWEREIPRMARMPLDAAALRATQRPIGLALRIGPYAGTFSAEGEPARTLKLLAAAMVEECRSSGLDIFEFQIDFDCPESKLDAYRTWVRVIREAVAPVPVVITALPSWLDRRAFRRLANTADGFVLQVHSIERPRQSHVPMQLCDPVNARRAVEQAGRIGVPFRVALPTYACLAAFDDHGEFVGVAAEAAPARWQVGARVREVRSNPAELAALVNAWTENRPASLKGIIWYRFPVESDRLNWRWSTLQAVMRGRVPVSKLRVQTVFTEPALLEVALVNEGEADAILERPIRLAWPGARLLAGDGLAGFTLAETGHEHVQFSIESRDAAARLGPGQRRLIGWVRLDHTVEVHHEEQ